MDEIERLAAELDRTTETCVHCRRQVVFSDDTECWFGSSDNERQDGYHCPDAPADYFGIKSHEV